VHAKTPEAPRQGTTIDWVTDLLIRFRWLFVVPIVLPLSKLFGLWLASRDFVVRTLRRAPERHEARVRDIENQILRWGAAGANGKLCTARPWWMAVSTRVVKYKRRENSIRIALYDILALDTERRVVRVEPLVSIGQLTAYLIPRGWTLPVVPELNDLTVGGLFLGYGVEVSSHKHGLFCDFVRSCDVVLGDGRTVRASPEENADLFNALPWSHGSLGFVVALELAIIPAKRFVHLTYHPTRGIRETCARFEREACRSEPAEFVEGFMFSSQEGVVTTGVFADNAEPGRVHYAHRWYSPWFALRCRRFLARGGGDEFIPLEHYYQRHVRGMYWESALLVPFGNHPLFRFLLGWLMPPKISFLRLTQGERLKRYYEEKHVIQDALVPMEKLEKTLLYFDRLFEAYPLWLCPMRLNRKTPRGFVNPGPRKGDHEMYVDLAVVSVPGPVLRGEDYNAMDALREMEAFLIENRGYQALYSVTQMSRQQFRRMFDCTLYDEVRRRCGSEGVFMDVYDKVRLPDGDPRARAE
jgi:FAD binding domain-containing protein